MFSYTFVWIIPDEVWTSDRFTINNSSDKQTGSCVQIQSNGG